MILLSSTITYLKFSCLVAIFRKLNVTWFGFCRVIIKSFGVHIFFVISCIGIMLMMKMHISLGKSHVKNTMGWDLSQPLSKICDRFFVYLKLLFIFSCESFFFSLFTYQHIHIQVRGFSGSNLFIILNENKAVYILPYTYPVNTRISRVCLVGWLVYTHTYIYIE